MFGCATGQESSRPRGLDPIHLLPGRELCLDGPLREVFRGYITANGPGRIKYTFTCSDGGKLSGLYLSYERRGARSSLL